MESATFEPGMFEWEKCIVCGNRFEDHPQNENGSYDCPREQVAIKPITVRPDGPGKYIVVSGFQRISSMKVQNENMQG